MNRRLAFLLLALVALALFARPLVRGEVLVFRDHSDYFQPMHWFTTSELRHFRLPLWNPYNASGEPWLANPQTAVFYPPAWIFLVLPFATAYILYLWMHVVLLGCGAFLFLSRMVSPRAAFLGALVLILCGPTLSLIDVSNNLTAFAWIPLVLWCALRPAPAPASGAAMAMAFFAGEPFVAALGAVAFVIVRLAAGGRVREIADAAVTAFLFSGIELLPFLEMLSGSDRAGAVPREEVLRNSMPLGDWRRLVLSSGPMHQQFIPSLYVGVVCTLLALIGLTAMRRSAAVRAASGVVVLCMIVASGSYLAPVGHLLASLPLTVLRYPSRVVPLAVLAIVILAAAGWDRVARTVPARWLWLAAVVLVIGDLVPHAAPFFASAPFDPHPAPYAPSIGRDGKIVRLLDLRQGPFDRRAWISGYLNLFGHRFDSWTAAPVVSQRYTDRLEAALTRPALLDAMSVRYLFSDRPIRPLPAVAASGRVAVYENPGAFPLAYWRDTAGHIVPASSLAITTSALHVAIDAPADGVVVVTQQSARGWSVEVDGRVAEGEREGVFRAVRVPRGHHFVSWYYRPRALFAGAALTAIAFVRLLFSMRFVKRRCYINFFSRA